MGRLRRVRTWRTRGRGSGRECRCRLRDPARLSDRVGRKSKELDELTLRDSGIERFRERELGALTIAVVTTVLRPDDAPTDPEVLRALPRAAGGGAAARA